MRAGARAAQRGESSRSVAHTPGATKDVETQDSTFRIDRMPSRETDAEAAADAAARTVWTLTASRNPLARSRLSVAVPTKHRNLSSSLPDHVRAVLGTGGEQLPQTISDQLGAAFDVDFGDVAIHQGALASRSAAEMNAQAYAIGRHVVFGQGRYAPHSFVGRELIAHELAHVAQQQHVTPRIQRKPDDQKTSEQKTPADQPPLLIVEGKDFDEAARNFSAMLAAKSKDSKAPIVVVNGPNVKVYDGAGKPRADKFFHLQSPAFVPVGVFAAPAKSRSLHAIGLDANGEWFDAGLAQLEGTVDFSKDIDDQEGYNKALAGVPAFYVSPRTTAVPPEADQPPPVPIENLPEFMKFEPKNKANLPAWPSATIALTPQIATVNSTGTFKCTVDKNQGYSTVDRVTNLMQPTAFRWEVLKLDEKLRVTSKRKTSGWDAAVEGYARRARNIEDDRKAMIGDPRKQSIPRTVLKQAMADQVSSARMTLAMAGQTVMTVINAITGGPNQLTTEDFMDVPFKEQGEFFVRCLATQIVPKDAKWRRATSVSGVMVSVFNIEDVARESLTSASDLTKEAEGNLEELQATLKALDEDIANGVGDPVLKRAERDFKALKIDYFKGLAAAGSNPHDRKVVELKYVRSALTFFKTSFPSDPTYEGFKKDQIAAFEKREKELDAEVRHMEGRLQERDSQITTVAYMPAVLVDELTGARMPLSFAVGERQYVAADKLEVVIADVSGKKGRIFDGSGGGFLGPGRHDAWLEAMDDLRKNLNRGRGWLSYEVPKAYAEWASDLPNPMQLQLSTGAQIKEMVDDTAHVLTLAAIMAAPFTGGGSLAILAVLAPIQAASSLYNIVNRAAYNDLELDSEAVFDLINIATLGLSKLTTASKLSSKAVQIVATSSRIAIRLLNGGQLILISFQTYQELMEPGDPNEDPRATRRRKLLKLLSWFEAASIPISEKVFGEAHGTTSKEAKARAQEREAISFDEPTQILGKKRTVSEGDFAEPKRPTETERPSEGGPAAEKTPAAGEAAQPVAYKPTKAQLSGVPAQLHSKVAVIEGMGRDARVVYKTSADGLITDVQIQIGERASAADVNTHVAIAKIMLRYSGVGGRVRRLAARFAALFTGVNPPQVGSRAWESRLEIMKLDRMMGERHAELARIADQPADQRDNARYAELMNDLDVMETQYAEHAAVFNAIEMGTAQGRGYVAVEGLSEGEQVRVARKLPRAPDGYLWRFRKGQLEVIVIEEGKPKLLYDEKSKSFVKDTGTYVPERFDVGVDRRKAFRELGGYDKKSSLGAFVEVLLEQGLIKSRQDVIDQMTDPSGRTHDTVRGNVKEIFKAELVKQITDPAYLRKTAEYRKVLKASGDPQQAKRAAGMAEMIRITDRIAVEDRGAIGERVYQELFGGKKGMVRVEISPAELAAAKGVDVSEIEQGRSIDRMDGSTARELKTVSSRLGPRERGQINDMLAMVGETVKPTVGSARELKSVVVTFLDPRGGVANATLAHEFLSNNPKSPLTFEFHALDGTVVKVTAKNMDILLKPEFASRLGL